ncbi:uncharacterized protein LOC135111799 isoform X1 [Scylla paramamosain]|uniref:uncharacterized protein LOC135111799 isoform X1 n=1 Tax=Scylla paramamosain TaxID=85552 RepID=UPI0030833B2B
MVKFLYTILFFISVSIRFSIFSILWQHIFSTQSEGSVIPPVHYPNFYSQHYHSNERSGVVAEDSFEEDNASASSEQRPPFLETSMFTTSFGFPLPSLIIMVN